MWRPFKVFFISLVDSFKENFGYHSASLTYQFLIVIGSIIMLTSFLSFYLPFFEPAKIYSFLRESLPSYAHTLLNDLISIYEKRSAGSLLSVILAYYFSVSFAKSLNTAFGYACGKKPVEKERLFIIFMPLLLILYVLILSLAVVLLTIRKLLLGGIYSRLGEVLNLLLIFVSIKMLYASYFKPKREVFIASAFVAFMFFFLNKVFSLVMVKLISLSPLYSVLGSPLLFLVWLYYSFYCLLVGAKLITALGMVQK